VFISSPAQRQMLFTGLQRHEFRMPNDDTRGHAGVC